MREPASPLDFRPGRGSGSRRRALALAAGLLSAVAGWSQGSAPPAAPAAPAPAQAEAAPQTAIRLDGTGALRHLNQAVSWYRHGPADIQALGLPSEVIYQDQAQSLATEVVRLAFQSARAEADLLKAQESAAAAQAQGGNSQAQRRAQAEARHAAKVQELQAHAAILEAQAAQAAGARRNRLDLQVQRVRSQLELEQALLDAIRKMKAFAENTGAGAGGFAGSIDDLARSIPEALGKPAEAAKPAGAAAGPGAGRPSFSSSGGLLSQLANLYDCMNGERQIQAVLARTDRLRAQAESVRDPLRAALRATIQASQELSDKPVPETGDSSAIQAETAQDKALTERFKQLSAALLPLSQEVMLLDDSKANLERWRALVQRASGHVLKAVLIRVSVLLAALVAILALSEAWRRVTFRYVKELRRRRSFLVLRRVVAGFLIAIVLVLGFVTEFSSLATFAGFITAGIAVGLQAVLLSVAAYFLIIGRYGIRVGDRISIAGITGDVVDVGLMRLYLMELAGSGVDLRPTGRIVVFANSVLFQASTPLFRQIPGTEYAWHEVVLGVVPDGNHRAVQDRLLAAVDQVYQEHRPELEQQHAAIERRVDLQVEVPRPEARLQLADAGLELLVRYPVALRRAREVDEQVTRKVLDLIGADPEIKAAVTGTPRIQSMLKG